MKTIPSYLTSWMFVAPFCNVTSSRRCMQAGVAQGVVISPVLVTLYVNNIPTPSYLVESAQYADDTTVVATSGKCVENYLITLEHWLQEWRIAINVDKCTALLLSSMETHPESMWPQVPWRGDPMCRNCLISGSNLWIEGLPGNPTLTRLYGKCRRDSTF